MSPVKTKQHEKKAKQQLSFSAKSPYQELAVREALTSVQIAKLKMLQDCALNADDNGNKFAEDLPLKNVIAACDVVDKNANKDKPSTPTAQTKSV